jgi:hypothetical protein
MHRRRALITASTLLGTTAFSGRPVFAEDAALPAGFGRAKRCILLFMWGGPSHIDTFDMKPEQPAEVRGPFQPIATSAAGIQVCEHFARVATVMDKVAVVRSLNHDDPAHLSSAHTILTGHLPPVNKSDDEPPSPRDTPHLGSVVSRLRPAITDLPQFVTLPWLAYHPSAPGGRAPGQSGGWLGRRYDPLLVEGDPNAAAWDVPALRLQDGLDLGRLATRQQLVEQIDRQRRGLDELAASRTYSAQQQQAFGLLSSATVREAFDLNAEPGDVRDRYGRNQHGQCVLLARRLSERGVPFVAVNWQEDDNPFWDTHGDNFNKLKNSLIRQADLALAALLEDLAKRGLLEETIVAWVGEFGRAPIINAHAGRDHHPLCYSGLLAGGGIRGGSIFGASEKDGRYPAESPVSPHDFSATLMHALGISPLATLPDAAGRPHTVYGGKPILPLFG